MNLKGIVALAVLAGTAVMAHAVTLVDQSDFNDNGWFSDGAANQFYDLRAAEGFNLAAASTIDTIEFWGGSENFLFDDLTNFASFEVAFWNASPAAPIPTGSPLWTQTFSKANTNPVDTGFLNVAGGKVYHHTINGLNINLGPGNFFMSVGSINVSPGDDAYAWSGTVSTYTGDHAQENGYGTGTWIVATPEDLAFRLSGPVPEPGTFIAIGAGLAGLVVARRRRK